MRKKIVAGNWKMNKTASESVVLVNEIVALLKENPVSNPSLKVIIAPPFVSLPIVRDVLKSFPMLYLAAQNCHSKIKGAYTGEVSVEMLKDISCNYVIIGHSERRSYFNENDAFLAEKVDVVIKNELIPVFCCGEVLSERQSGQHKNVVFNQIKNALFSLDAEDFSKVVIAYEPVWAIGTGVTASPDEAQEMHSFIRQTIAGKYGAAVADETTILYGGSCNAKNAKELFGKPDVDGGLIGGASLIALDFVTIIHALI